MISAKSDVDSANQMAGYLTSNQGERDAYIAELWTRAEDLVNARDNWRTIEALASVLLERRQFNYEEATGVIKAVLPAGQVTMPD